MLTSTKVLDIPPITFTLLITAGTDSRSITHHAHVLGADLAAEIDLIDPTLSSMPPQPKHIRWRLPR